MSKTTEQKLARVIQSEARIPYTAALRAVRNARASIPDGPESTERWKKVAMEQLQSGGPVGEEMARR